MTVRTRLLALGLLAGVVAVSSALAGGDPKRPTRVQPTQQSDGLCGVDQLNVWTGSLSTRVH